MAKKRGYTFDVDNPEKPFVCDACPKRFASEGSWKLHNHKVHTAAGRIPTTGERRGLLPLEMAQGSGAPAVACPHDWILLDPGRNDLEAVAFERGYTRLCRLCEEVS